MNIIRRALPLALVTLLAACGSTGTTPDPTSTPDPTTKPPVGEPAPTPSGSDESYIGRWQVVFTADDGTSFAHLLGVATTYKDEQQDGGFGSQHLCTGQGSSLCNETSTEDTGLGFIGTITIEDGLAPLSLVIYDKAGRKVYTTENLSTETDAQGRQVLKGAAVWLKGSSFSNSVTGTVTATNVSALETPEPQPGDPTPSEDLTGIWLGTTVTPSSETVETDFSLIQSGSSFTGNLFITSQSGDVIAPSLIGTTNGNGVILFSTFTTDDNEFTYVYSGVPSETTLEGQVTITPKVGDTEQGTFSISKHQQ